MKFKASKGLLWQAQLKSPLFIESKEEKMIESIKWDANYAQVSL